MISYKASNTRLQTSQLPQVWNGSKATKTITNQGPSYLLKPLLTAMQMMSALTLITTIIKTLNNFLIGFLEHVLPSFTMAN
jgi:hypothetical protein